MHHSSNGLKTRLFFGFIRYDNPALKRGCSAGFTLIELFVVVFIIAILSSVIVTSVLILRDKSRDVRIVSEVDQLKNIAQLLRKDYESYQDLCSGGTLNEGAPDPYGEQLGALENDIGMRQGGALDINCKANINSYCLDVNLITSGAGRYCITDDGNGNAMDENFSCASADDTCE